MKRKVVSPEEVELDAYEQEIEAHFGEAYYPAETKRKKMSLVQEAIKNTIKDTRITLRISSTDLENIKARAEEKGLRYQTYIASLLHQAALGRINI